ncbi:hypothetical protein VTN96DRAFT_3740 [Rasamsonia emersonii]
MRTGSDGRSKNIDSRSVRGDGARHWQVQVTRAWGGDRADLRGSTRDLHMTPLEPARRARKPRVWPGSQQACPAFQNPPDPLATCPRLRQKKRESLGFQLGFPSQFLSIPFHRLASLPQTALPFPGLGRHVGLPKREIRAPSRLAFCGHILESRADCYGVRPFSILRSP